MMAGTRDDEEDLDLIDAEFQEELDGGKLRRRRRHGRSAAAEEPEEPRAPALPEFLGAYRVSRHLSQGGMGEVLLAHDPDGLEVAIKILPLDREWDHELHARFARELRAISALDHPHVVGYLDSGEDPVSPYLVMERVRGPSLQWFLDHCGGMSEGDTIDLARQLALALAECWRLGFVHRDVKPDNILLDGSRPGRGERFCAKLCDFGLVNFLELGPEDFHTDPTQSIGTPAYMSPEQVCGFGQADPRHDIYGLGMTMASAVLGTCPVEEGSTRQVIMHKLEHRLDLSVLRERVDLQLYRLIEAMTAPAEERIADWSQVLDRLEAIDRQSSAHAPASARRATGLFILALLGLVAALGMLGMLGVLLMW